MGYNCGHCSLTYRAIYYYTIVIYQTIKACQKSISGGRLDCEDCKLNGAGKCDRHGCPSSTVYNIMNHICEGIFRQANRYKLSFMSS